MGTSDLQTRLFEDERARLRALAYRMLGSLSEADDAVQDGWLRLARVEMGDIGNLSAWLTTVVSRICLDMLRARHARAEEPVSQVGTDRHGEPQVGSDPEQEAVLIDSVGRALLVVLDTLGPRERVAFVLHDMFAVPFAEIAEIVGSSPAAAKKLASRARVRVHGTPPAASHDRTRERRIVEAFLAASRAGDIDGLLEVLAPDVVRRADQAVLPAGAAGVARGAGIVAEETRVLGRRARHASVALVNGRIGAVVAPHGRLSLVLTFVIADGRIAEYEVIADSARLAGLELLVV